MRFSTRKSWCSNPNYPNRARSRVAMQTACVDGSGKSECIAAGCAIREIFSGLTMRLKKAAFDLEVWHLLTGRVSGV